MTLCKAPTGRRTPLDSLLEYKGDCECNIRSLKLVPSSPALIAFLEGYYFVKFNKIRMSDKN